MLSDEVVGHLFAREALVGVLEGVGKELTVLFEVVGLVRQEVVQLS